MLKRQRPPSPPSSVPSVPLVEDTHPDTTRDVKRRRILPPSLDPKSRGWTPCNLELDDDEEFTPNNEKPANPSDAGLACTVDLADYKQANTVLHEVHTLHQHRLLFASTHDSASHGSILSQRLPQHAQSTHGSHQDGVPPKMITTLQPEVPGCDYSSSPYPHSYLSKEELQRVTQRYGDTNRLLGSLFLSRRRQLDNSEEEII